MTWGDVALVAALIVLWSTFSHAFARWGISEPLVFVTAGVACGGVHDLSVSAQASSVRLLAEVTLVLVLFADASRVRIHSLQHDPWLPARLLGIGLPLTVILGALFAHVLQPHSGWWAALLLGAVLAPTDASLGASIVTDPRLPARVRRALNVESGLNDGIVTPVVALAIAAVVGTSATIGTHVQSAVVEIALGALVGLALGALVGRVLATAVQRHWTDGASLGVAVTATALGSYGLATVVHGNGFIAAFLGGLAFGASAQSIAPQLVEVDEQAGQLLGCFVWYVFGAAMLRLALSSSLLPRAALYAVVSLTLIRLVPVALALVRSRLGHPTVAYIGWFGPRGLASVVFTLLAADELGQRVTPLVTYVSITIALSVLLHGLSANPLTTRYVQTLRSLSADAPVLAVVPVPPTSRRRFHGTGPTPS